MLSAVRRSVLHFRGVATVGARMTSNLSAADMEYTRQLLLEKDCMIIDCDGVLYHGDHALPGAREFVDFLQKSGKKYVFLTNASDKSAAMLVKKFAKLGFHAKEEEFFTSSMCTAMFLRRQKKFGRAFVIGNQSLKEELEKEGTTVVSKYDAEMSTPDFVVVGEAHSQELYNFELLEFAVKLVRRGSRLIGTNEDVADRIGNEMQPGTGALTLPIEAASGYQCYYVGKPNPLMVRSALDKMGGQREKAIVVGDRMNTDIRAGVEAGVDTILVLSGVTSEKDILQFAYRPSSVLSGVGDIASILQSKTGAKPSENQ